MKRQSRVLYIFLFLLISTISIADTNNGLSNTVIIHQIKAAGSKVKFFKNSNPYIKEIKPKKFRASKFKSKKLKLLQIGPRHTQIKKTKLHETRVVKTRINRVKLKRIDLN